LGEQRGWRTSWGTLTGPTQESGSRDAISVRHFSAPDASPHGESYRRWDDIQGEPQVTTILVLGTWCSQMIRAFDLGIDLPRLKVERLGPGLLGLYRHVGISLSRAPEVVLDETFLRSAPQFATCAIALHELVHGWESSVGGRRIAVNGGYHSDQFRSKTRSLGLLVDVGGHTWTAAGETPFTSFLRMNEIELPGSDSSSVLAIATVAGGRVG